MFWFLRISVHGGIRHLENHTLTLNNHSDVHGGIRHLENMKN
ncbi:hypothetical protein J558_0350 [Acinetobacter baumannii 1106579]|nr:hypothetical protein J558_0350 [Acinetobacter baumannii 1106579]